MVRGIGKWGCSGIGKCVLAYILPILSHPEGWVTPGNRKRSPLERIDAGRRGGSHHCWPCRLPAEEEPKPPSSPELESSPPPTPGAGEQQTAVAPIACNAGNPSRAAACAARATAACFPCRPCCRSRRSPHNVLAHAAAKPRLQALAAGATECWSTLAEVLGMRTS